MRITKLFLQNYRVYEKPLELEFPTGLIGIYGPNGAGKSYLIESILWTLFGKARTSKEGVRTTDISAPCVTRVEFEHQGHYYEIQREIVGLNSSIKARAFANGQQVSEGNTDTRKYVHSILGMDDVSFKASVFAEQKQIAAFSDNTPGARRDLVLSLLGVTSLDTARDKARKDARSLKEELIRLKDFLPDMEKLDLEYQQLLGEFQKSEKLAKEKQLLCDIFHDKAEKALLDIQHLDEAMSKYDYLIRQGKTCRSQLDQETNRQIELQQELDTFAALETKASQLKIQIPALSSSRGLYEILSQFFNLTRQIQDLPKMEPPGVFDTEKLDNLRANLDLSRGELSKIDGKLAATEIEMKRVSEELKKSETLSNEHDCPLCGQSLANDSYLQIRHHREQDVVQVKKSLEELSSKRQSLFIEVEEKKKELKQQEQKLEAFNRKSSQYENLMAQKSFLEAEKKAVLDQLEDKSLAQNLLSMTLDQLREKMESTSEQITQLQHISQELAAIQAKLERKPTLEKEISRLKLNIEQLNQTRQDLLLELKELNCSPDTYKDQKNQFQQIRNQYEKIRLEAQECQNEFIRKERDLDAAKRRIKEAKDSMMEVNLMKERVRHIAKVAELLNDFRNNVINSIGPRLGSQAAELFGELTDHEYDRLEVDTDTYQIRIQDKGQSYRMERFSGSETDLANLAFRVAISEQVRFQSGGAVGLLVLDEVFGPLDSDRKHRMLNALEHLRSRFGQILVVTHDDSIKEQLPHAIEVQKLPGRRATASVTN